MMSADGTPVLQEALALLAAGISVIPVKRDGTKRPPLKEWKPYQSRLATEREARAWWCGDEPPGIAAVCGAISGGLELIDFDRDADAIYPAWRALVEAERPGLVERLTRVRTPRLGPVGRHVAYRCPGVAIAGNQTLALDPDAPDADTAKLIETRGEGGYFVVPGSPWQCHADNYARADRGEPPVVWSYRAGPTLHSPAEVTPGERECLLRCARSFDRRVPKQPSPPPEAVRPGDDYDRRGPDWSAILAGWDCVRQDGALRYWRRPGKEGPGWSATTGVRPGGLDMLWVFSERADLREGLYGKFRAMACLRYGGDCSACARDLAREGYGSGGPQRKPDPPPAAPPPLEAPKQPPPTYPDPVPVAELVLPNVGQEWLWEGWLAGGEITLLSALWKSGKTTLLAHLMKAFERGGTFCGCAVRPASVLYVTEEHQGRWAQRRDELGLAGPLDFIVRPFRVRPKSDQWEGFLGHLAGLVKERAYGVVVCDTLANLWPVRDENDASAVGAALMPLHAVAEAGAGLLLVHHNRKSDGEEATASRGSGALPGFVDTIAELRRFNAGDRKDRKRVLQGYGRHEETPGETVVELTAAGFTVPEGGNREGMRRIDLTAALSGLLPSDGGMTIDEVMGGWPEAQCPRKTDLLAALKAGVEAGRFAVDGEGKKGSPFRYRFVPFGGDEGPATVPFPPQTP